MQGFKNRKTTRLQGADYNNGAFFLTICTKDRNCILSHIVGTGVLDGPEKTTDVIDCPEVKLTRYGEIAKKYINQLNDFYNNISVESYVIMPDHIHIMLLVTNENGVSETPMRSSRTPTESSRTPMGPSRTPMGPSRTPMGPSRTPVPTVQNTVVARFLSTFKRFCNKEYGMNIWQYRSYDHIIRNKQDYEEHLRYIYENPLRWYYNELK